MKLRHLTGSRLITFEKWPRFLLSGFRLGFGLLNIRLKLLLKLKFNLALMRTSGLPNGDFFFFFWFWPRAISSIMQGFG